MDFYNAKDFKHQRLPVSTDRPMIRLVELIPVTQTVLLLELNIIHVSLADCPDYEALSYCWGGQEPNFPIPCNNHRLLITRNVANALRYLRHKDKKRILWIDAICINQSDLGEKNYQVAMMYNIYRSAREVHVWLGPESEDSKEALSLVPRIQNDDSLNAITRTRRLDKMDPQVREKLFAFFRLMGRPWFSRVWVVQEVAARSGQRVFVHCGSQSVSWWEFRNATSCINDNLYMFQFFSPKALRRIVAFHVACDSLSHQNARRLLALLIRHRDFDSTDPRDKIFALCGLARDIGPKELNIKPDYNLNAAEVYTRVAISILKQSRSLDILSVPRITSLICERRI